MKFRVALWKQSTSGGPLLKTGSRKSSPGERILDRLWTEVDGIRAAGTMTRLGVRHASHGPPRVPEGGRDCRQPVLCYLQWYSHQFRPIWLRALRTLLETHFGVFPSDDRPPRDRFREFPVGRFPNSIDTPGQLIWRRSKNPFKKLTVLKNRV